MAHEYKEQRGESRFMSFSPFFSIYELNAECKDVWIYLLLKSLSLLLIVIKNLYGNVMQIHLYFYICPCVPLSYWVKYLLVLSNLSTLPDYVA